MDPGLELTPIPQEKRIASMLDVMLVFAGANIVATTLVTGGSLGPAFGFKRACLVILAGVAVGSGLVALLARLGPRFGVPTMVLFRTPFGRGGAALVAGLLVVTNFAWIALNNVIAARAMAHVAGGPEWAWNLGVGTLAIAIATQGPRAMALFDRVAVPLLLVVGGALTWALFGAAGRAALERPGSGELPLLAGLDLVVGYQVSWSLMFADYTRYQRREGAAAAAVLLGLALTSLWLMPLGAGAGLAGGGNDPTAMIVGLGLPLAALLMMALSTVTTNFVNLYLSALAAKNLRPRAPDRRLVLAIGVVGTGFGLLSPRLLDAYAAFMGWLATLLLPLAAIVAVHFFVRRGDGGAAAGATSARWRPPALVAWGAGAVAYQLATRLAPQVGATLPALLVSGAVYAGLGALAGRRDRRSAAPAGGSAGG